MRRLILVPLAALAVAGISPTASASAAFTFPKVSSNLDAKPTIGPARAPAPKRLQTKDVVTGKGRTARPGDLVTANYVGVLYRSGRQFDASWDGGQAFEFQLGAGAVIRGWDKGVAGMRVGGRRVLVIPARLAYGDAGVPPDVPPRATLTFVVDLERVAR